MEMCDPLLTCMTSGDKYDCNYIFAIIQSKEIIRTFKKMLIKFITLLYFLSHEDNI